MSRTARAPVFFSGRRAVSAPLELLRQVTREPASPFPVLLEESPLLVHIPPRVMANWTVLGELQCRNKWTARGGVKLTIGYIIRTLDGCALKYLVFSP